jgi:hypothetical protein
MAINLSDNIKISAPLPVDSRYFNNLVPYTSKTEVINTIPVGERYIGLTVNINGVEYWFESAIASVSDLVLKINAGTLIGATNGLHLVSGGTVVALGGVLTGDTEFNNGSYVLKYQTHPFFSNDTEIVDKRYVDMVALGLQPKMSVKVATTGDTLLDGSVTSVDGISIANGDRILVKSQSDNIENGIYIANTTGWTRSNDFNTSGETTQGSLIPVITGATNKNTLWVLITENAIPDTTPMEFGLFSSSAYIAGNGIIISGSTILIDGASLAGTCLDWNTGTNQFDVDCASIIAGLVAQSNFNTYTGTTQPILNVALTGATNGLGISGRNVCLGGCLNVNTLVDACGNDLTINNIGEFQVTTPGSSTVFGVDNSGFLLSFSGGSASFDDIGGIKYGGCYHCNYTDRSLVDKEYVDNMSSGSTVYNGTTPSTVKVGGLCAGITLTGRTWESLLQEILVEYLVPSFSSFSVSTGSIIEVGTTISGCPTFSWAFLNCGNVCSSSMCILDVTAGVTLPSGCNISKVSPATTVQICTKTFTYCGQPQQWRGRMKDTCSVCHDSSLSQTTAIYPYYWGICTCPGGAGCNRPTTTCAMVVAGCKVLQPSNTSISIIFNSTDNDYLWFAVPSTVSKVCWCTPSAPTNNGAIGGGVSPACNLFPAPDVVSVTSACWTGVNYNVYVSNAQTGVVIPMALT